MASHGVDMSLEDLAGPALDLAMGTGDFALELASRPAVSHVVGLDYNREMLSIAARKARRKGLSRRVSLLVGDAHSLPFANEHFICATVGFGIRNFVDVPEALREMARVVKPGGRVTILEIVRVDGTGPVARLFPLYFRHVTPSLGALLAGDREAYTYLPESVESFQSAREIATMMEDAGLHNVTFRSLALGSVAIHMGHRE